MFVNFLNVSNCFSENAEGAGNLFKTLYKIAKEPMEKVRVIMTDLSKVYRAAWKRWMSDVNPNVKFIGCSWHFDRAVVLNIKEPEILAAVFALRLCPLESDFWALFEQFDEDFGETESGSYFIRNYGRHGAVAKPEIWARCFNRKFCPHNLFAERYS